MNRLKMCWVSYLATVLSLDCIPYHQHISGEVKVCQFGRSIKPMISMNSIAQLGKLWPIPRKCEEKPKGRQTEIPRWIASLPINLKHHDSFQSCVSKVSALDFIMFKLPAANTVAGRVLQHSCEILFCFVRIYQITGKIFKYDNPVYQR